MKPQNISYWVMPVFQRPSPEDLMNRVCKHFDITIDKLKSSSRKLNCVEARRVISYVLYTNQRTELTYKDIGKMLGNRNHATILHLVRVANNFMDVDKSYKELIMSFY